MISAPKHLGLAYDDYLDDPRRWTIDMRPPWFDAVAYQKRLDAITGVKGAIRLRWAPEWTVFKPRPTGEKVADDFVPANSALNDEFGRPVSPPRWMLLERVEPEQYAPTWERNRWFNDPRDGLRYDLRGPCPTEYYKHHLTIAAHDDFCCQSRRREMFVCWGYYKHPGEQELRQAARSWRKSLADSVDPHSPVEALGETQHERDVASEMQNSRLRKTEEARYRARHMLSIYQPSELRQLREAMIQRLCVVEHGKKIHQAVEKVERIEHEQRIG